MRSSREAGTSPRCAERRPTSDADGAHRARTAQVGGDESCAAKHPPLVAATPPVLLRDCFGGEGATGRTQSRRWRGVEADAASRRAGWHPQLTRRAALPSGGRRQGARAPRSVRSPSSGTRVQVRPPRAGPSASPNPAAAPFGRRAQPIGGAPAALRDPALQDGNAARGEAPRAARPADAADARGAPAVRVEPRTAGRAGGRKSSRAFEGEEHGGNASGAPKRRPSWRTPLPRPQPTRRRGGGRGVRGHDAPRSTSRSAKAPNAARGRDTPPRTPSARDAAPPSRPPAVAPVAAARSAGRRRRRRRRPTGTKTTTGGRDVPSAPRSASSRAAFPMTPPAARRASATPWSPPDPASARRRVRRSLVRRSLGSAAVLQSRPPIARATSSPPPPATRRASRGRRRGVDAAGERRARR